MRKIVAAPFLSLDGVVELSEQWTIPCFTADMQRVIQQGMAAADTMLMGRLAAQGRHDRATSARGALRSSGT